MGTLTSGVISTTYKNLIFQKIDNKIYYTNSSDIDTEITTFASALTLSGLITATAGIKTSTIFDSGGNEAIVCAATGSAVNHLGITNGAAGTPGAVSLTTLGDSSNVDLTLTPKGTGIVNCTPKLKAILGVQLGNNIIFASDGGAALTLTDADNLTVGGDLTVTGNDILYGTAGASTLQVKEATGTDTAGGALNIAAGQGTGTGAGGAITFQVANGAGGTGSSANALATAVTIADDTNVTFAGDIAISGGNITTALQCDSTLGVTGITTLANNLVFTGGRDIIWPDASGLEMKTTDAGGDSYLTFTANVITVGQPMNCSGLVTMGGNTGSTAAAGIHASRTQMWTEKIGGMYKTSIYIDLEGLASIDIDKDVIGLAAGGAAYIGKIESSKHGAIKAIQMTCLEVPVTGSLDIDLYNADEATYVYNDPLVSTSSTEFLIVDGAGNWANGEIKGGTTITFGATEYLYLVNGAASGAGTYGSGKFLIELYGT